jgi:hypothetical protein
MGREDRIYREAAALWRELFREPPPARADGPALLDLIMRKMPDLTYDRVRTPHLRPTNITMPRRA